MNSINYIEIYLVIINILGFALMGDDKRRAIKHYLRIPEATLFAVAIVGGSLGCTLGMFIFRHKTKHWYFLFGLPIILFIHLLTFAFLYFGPIQFSFM
ncbi:MAG: DUF1294 domain-containing protein [Butyrivibrio sp.]|nr:DUF1294 domain-containing protein [Butyrivibrio sp.]